MESLISIPKVNKLWWATLLCGQGNARYYGLGKKCSYQREFISMGLQSPRKNAVLSSGDRCKWSCGDLWCLQGGEWFLLEVFLLDAPFVVLWLEGKSSACLCLLLLLGRQIVEHPTWDQTKRKAGDSLLRHSFGPEVPNWSVISAF